MDLYPRLVVEGADDAIAFYVAALGATCSERATGPDGRVQHALLTVDDVHFAVKDADALDPAPDGASPVVLALYCDDPDAVAGAMLAHGATVLSPVADQPYGERAGRVRDPYGHPWMLARPL